MEKFVKLLGDKQQVHFEMKGGSRLPDFDSQTERTEGQRGLSRKKSDLCKR